MDWFCSNNPKVTRYVGIARTQIEQVHMVETTVSGEPLCWRKLKKNYGYDVYWFFGKGPALVCNGIFVTNSAFREKYSSKIVSSDQYYRVRHPNVSVRDPDGHFPLDLQRNALGVDSYPFEQQLVNSAIRDFLACLLVGAPYRFDPSEYLSEPHKGVVSTERDYHSAFDNDYGQSFLFKKGLSILDPHIISQLKLKNAAYVFGFDNRDNMQLQHDALFLNAGYYSAFEFFSNCRETLNDASVGFHETETLGFRAVISKSFAQEIVKYKGKSKKTANYIDCKRKALNMLNHASLHFEELDADWMLAETSQCPPSKGNFVHFQKEAIGGRKREVALVEVFFKEPPCQDSTPGLIGKAWNKIIGMPYIPFDQNERQKELSHAFSTLKHYIDMQKLEATQHRADSKTK